MLKKLVRSDVTIVLRNLMTEVAFKNCGPLTKCITKIHGITANDAEDLDLVILI